MSIHKEYLNAPLNQKITENSETKHEKSLKVSTGSGINFQNPESFKVVAKIPRRSQKKFRKVSNNFKKSSKGTERSRKKSSEFLKVLMSNHREYLNSGTKHEKSLKVTIGSGKNFQNAERSRKNSEKCRKISRSPEKVL